MGILGTMTVSFNANVTNFQNGIKTVTDSTSSFAKNTQKGAGVVLGAFALAGAAVVGFGALSVKSAADFQQSMLKVAAYAGLSKQQTDAMSNSILDMSTKVGQSPKVLADAIYPIISSGYGAADALNILNLSAKTAAASGAQTSVVADALTTSLGAMHAPASEAGHYMDMLNKIVSLGKGEVPQYAAVIGKLSLAANGAGVDFATAGAALADLTTHGFPSVAQASTSLGNLFTQIGVKTDALAQHAKKAGIAFDAHKFATLDLSDKLNYLQKITGGNQGELLKLVGGSTVALKAFNALEGGSKNLTSNLEAMKNSAGATDSAFKTASSGLNATMARAQASIETLQVKIGTALLPVITALVDKVAPAITSFLDWSDKNHIVENAVNGVTAAINGISVAMNFIIPIVSNVVHFFQQHHEAMVALQPVLIAVAGVLGGLLVAALTSVSIAAWAAMAPFLVFSGPFVLIGAIVALVVAGIVIAIQHWGQISGWLQGAWQGFLSWWHGFSSEFMGVLSAIGSFFVSVWQGAVSAAISVWNGLKSAGSAVLSWFNTWKPIIEGVAGAITIFFLPAMIKAGVQAAISGAQIAANFIKSMVTTGVEATVNGAKVTAEFIKSMITSGVESVVNGAKVTANFVKSMITSGIEAAAAGIKITINFVASVVKSGIEAAIAGGKIVASFVSSLIATGLEGWGAAGKLGLYIASVIASGAQSVIAGAKVVGSFIASLITTGIQAAITGGMIVASFVASLVSAGIEAIVSAGIFLATLVPSLLAVAAGVIAATWPFLLIAAVVAVVVVGIILAIQHWSDIVKWFQGVWAVTWSAVSNFFIGIWNGIKSFFTAAWNFIITAAIIAAAVLFVVITGPIGLIALYIITHWSQVHGWLVNAWNSLKSFASTAFNAVVNVITGVFSGLLSGAFNFGSNIIKQLAAGINNAIHFVTDAITNVTSWISAHLPHSPAKVGPLRDLILQGSMIPDQIATGMLGNQSKLNSAIAQLAKPISTSLNLNSSSYPSGSSNNSAAILAAVASSASSNSNNNQSHEFHIYIDGKEVTSKLGPHIANAIRASGAVRAR